MALDTASDTAAWVQPILGALDREQRAAATLPDGPAQIIAPAGSGKTTTLIARLAVLMGRGVTPAEICVVTFNRDAALDMARRIQSRLVPHIADASSIEVRTLHALARQVVIGARGPIHLVADRLPLIRAARRACSSREGPPLSEASEIDGLVSAWKIEGRAPPDTVRPVIEAYRNLLRSRDALDFDDLVVQAYRLLEADASLRLHWQSRFAHVLVDEFQDVDSAQLRLVRILAAPQENLMVVGDDDQTIYAWRLADVRRILRFTDDYPGARRVMLATNYRCPASVIAASARMVARNRERFDKPIRPPTGAPQAADAIAALSTADPEWPNGMARLAASETADGRTVCFLSRTRGELTPIFLALVHAGVRHANTVPPLVDAEPVKELIAAVRGRNAEAHPFHLLHTERTSRGWERGALSADELRDEDHAALDALLGWATAFRELVPFVAAYDAVRARLAELADPNALVELATVHAAKGREWRTVVLIGFEADRIPNRRSLANAADPERAMEEERRLAYVALTRATDRLILAFDPTRPSPFLHEMGLNTAA